MPPRTIHDMLTGDKDASPPVTRSNIPDTPQTQKHQRPDYRQLNSYRMQGRPIPVTTHHPQKRPRLNSTNNAHKTLSTPVNEQDSSTLPLILLPPSPTPVNPKETPNIKKNAYWWKFFDVKRLDKKFMTGRNNKKREAFDELYTCNVCQGYTFSCQASHLHTSVSALKDHIEGHQISESTDPVTVQAGNPQPMKDWINSSTIDNPLFAEALLD
jgi:hypothetical protein